MSTQELQTLAQQFADAFNKKNLSLVLDMLSEDVEVFDHVPYRFDNKAQFASYLSEATEGIASMSFGFRQPSYRVFNGSTGIMNAYDSFLSTWTEILVCFEYGSPGGIAWDGSEKMCKNICPGT